VDRVGEDELSLSIPSTTGSFHPHRCECIEDTCDERIGGGGERGEEENTGWVLSQVGNRTVPDAGTSSNELGWINKPIVAAQKIYFFMLVMVPRFINAPA